MLRKKFDIVMSGGVLKNKMLPKCLQLHVVMSYVEEYVQCEWPKIKFVSQSKKYICPFCVPQLHCILGLNGSKQINTKIGLEINRTLYDKNLPKVNFLIAKFGIVFVHFVSLISLCVRYN